MANSIRTFWRRVSDGIEIQQLWAQFHAEARASYEMYSKEVDWTRLTQNLGGHRFTTAFLAELEPATGRLTYVNAGQNWPMLRRASGAIERLEIGGLPLGIRPHARYECGNTSLGASDLLLIFTDGLVEAEDEKEQEFGELRMLGLINAAFGKSAADVLHQLMASVDAFVGLARQHDDITCMVLRTFN